MASAVDICNLALACLGDEATVASIDPPEGSVQAEYCARFYSIARDALLEMHPWGFATRYVQLAAVAAATPLRPEWRFAYAQPSDAIKIVAVLAPDAATLEAGIGNAQPFSRETGAGIILTNQADARALYVASVKDTTRFAPLFVQALAWHLASMLAGPLLKGEAGAAESKRCVGVMQGYLSLAMVSDANQRKTGQGHVAAHLPAWMRERGAGLVDGDVPGLPSGWRG